MVRMNKRDTIRENVTFAVLILILIAAFVWFGSQASWREAIGLFMVMIGLAALLLYFAVRDAKRCNAAWIREELANDPDGHKFTPQDRARLELWLADQWRRKDGIL